MPRCADLAEVRARLETDRAWAAYALGDLAPGYAEHCEWHLAAGRAPALALLYRAFETPVLFVLGAPAALGGVLDEIAREPRMYLSVGQDSLPLIQARWTVPQATPMWRMRVTVETFRPAPRSDTARLGSPDLPALYRLFADGAPAGEAPDFFDATMLARGVFFGVWERAELVAVAGTHLVVPAEGVGAVGNVYTRRDRRGQGLAGRATSAVTAELLAMDLRTVVLNVSQANAAAIGVYERLGYTRHCPFYEGLATLD